MPSPEKFRETLSYFTVDESIVKEINKRYEDVLSKTNKKIKRDYAMPREYCYCCSGHFKFHYEIMLNVRPELPEIVSSPHDNIGEEPCVFRYRIINNEEL